MKREFRNIAISLMLVLGLCSCASTAVDKHEQAASTGLTIQVFAWGDIAKAGKYDIPEGASLADLIATAGGLGAGPSGEPIKAVITRQTDGMQSELTVRVRNPDESNTFTLLDGDIVRFPRIVW